MTEPIQYSVPFKMFFLRSINTKSMYTGFIPARNDFSGIILMISVNNFSGVQDEKARAENEEAVGGIGPWNRT